MFYFWNVDQLVKDLRAGIVTEVEKMRYLLITSMVELLALQQVSTFTPMNPYEILIKFLFFGVQVGIVIWGIQHCFYMNHKNDNKNFIERFVCLGLPVGIRLGVYCLIGTIVGALIFGLGLLVFSPKMVHATSELINGNAATAGLTTKVVINVNSFAKQGLLRMHVFTYVFEIIFSIIFFLTLGKKIDAVGKPE